MSQYDCKIIYIKGEDNGAADVLSHTSFDAEIEALAPYPPDNCDVVAMILGSKLSAFRCAHIMMKLKTLALPVKPIATMLTISMDEELLDAIRSSYAEDNWCT